MSRSALRVAVVVLALAGAGTLVRDGWWCAKGVVAGLLVDRATDAFLVDGEVHRPWSWADFHPVGRIDVEARGVSRPILSGATGAVLAFGLGHVDGTAPPGGPGLSVVGGHRDGYAAFLGDLVPGDLLTVRTARGATRWVVSGTRRVRDRRPVVDPGPGDRLWLVTCWPVDGVRRTDARYVVEAVPESR